MDRHAHPTPEQFLAAFNQTEQLAPAPRTLGRVLRLLRQPQSGIQDIAELISRDSGLTAEVLRCANSAYYSRGLRVAAIHEALQVIGFHETIRIVSLVAVRQTAHRDLTSYGVNAEDFWAESLFNGLFLESLGRGIPGIDVGEAYTAGLLRFIGRLAINQAIEVLGFGLFWDGTAPLAAWELEHVGLTQAQVGARLLRRWEFPAETVSAIETQDAVVPTAALVDPPLLEAVRFTAALLPAGLRVSDRESVTAGARAAAATHPFATRGQVSTAMLDRCLDEAYASLEKIRETLYR